MLLVLMMVTSRNPPVSASPPMPGRWSVIISTASGLPQDAQIAAMGNNVDGWGGGGLFFLGHLAQGFEVGQHATLLCSVFEGGIIGIDGTPIAPGHYTAPSIELPPREFDVVNGLTYYVIAKALVIESNILGFNVGDTFTVMWTFDTVLGRIEQLVVLWANFGFGFFPFANEGLMMTNLQFHP